MADIEQLKRALINADAAGDTAAATALAGEIRRMMGQQAAPEPVDPLRAKAEEMAAQIEAAKGKAGAGELFINQFTGGLLDKVSGLAAGLPYILPGGESFSDRYKIGSMAQQIREDRAREDSGALGTAAEIGGALSMGGLAKAPAAASWLGRIAQTAKEGAVLGGLSGAGNSEADSLAGTLGDATLSAGLSAGMGGALQGGLEVAKPLVGGMVRSGRALVDMNSNEATRAAKRVTDALAQDGLTPQKAIGRMQRADTALINVGGKSDDGLMRLARGVHTKPGVGSNIIGRGLDAQQKASSGKAVEAITDALGGADKTFNKRLAEMTRARAARANVVYEKAFRQNFKNGHSMVFDDLQSRIPSEAMRNALKIARAEGRPFGQQLVAALSDDAPVQFLRKPSLREWHYIQRGLRSAKEKAFREGVGEVGVAYKNLHEELLKAMDTANPTYGMARTAYATESQMMEALKQGRELMRPANMNNLDAFADDFATLSKPEKEMVRIGLARGLEDLVQSTPDAAGNVVRKIFGTPQKRAAIRSVFESDSAFRRFEVKMNRMAKELRNFALIRTQSVTADKGSDAAAISGIQDAADAAFSAVRGQPVTAMMQGLRRLIGSMGGVDDKVGEQIARILMEKDPGLVMKALSPSVKANVKREAQDAIRQLVFERARALAIGGSVAASSTLATAQ